MRPRKDRNIEGVSLSFLDVISCGFGAVILLLVLTRVFDPVTIDPSITDLDGYLEKLQEELIELKGETLVLNRTLIRREDQQAEEIDQLTRITSEQA
ncbi:MAG: VWA domain-containing protein, partial [Gammaproteobacteria bacterium]